MYIINVTISLQAMNVGDLSERFKLKEKLQCKNFTWFITNIWQELLIFDNGVFAWGSVSIPLAIQ